MNNRNKALIITGVVIIVLGAGLFLIGGALEGWDFAEFFKSPTFLWICVLIGLYILFVIFIFVKEWYKKL